MADIQSLSIFGSKNKGLQKIKDAASKNETTQVPSPAQGKNVTERNNTLETHKRNKVISKEHKERTSKKSNNGVGAPIKNYDRIHTASQPIKLSALLNSTSRVLNEKYMSGYTRDEILRLALDDYIKMNFTKEDKIDLFRDVSKELSLFREKHPTIPKEDMSIEEIESQSAEEIKNNWGL